MAEETFTDGTLSGVGDYDTDGRRHGPWVFFHKNGQEKARGVFEHDKMQGFWTWWRTNGELLQKGAFEQHVQVGHWERFFDNGRLWDIGEYTEEGRRVGEWKVYDREGELKKTTVH